MTTTTKKARKADATVDDAQTLAEIWGRLSAAVANLRDTEKAIQNTWGSGLIDRPQLRDDRDKARALLDTLLDGAWEQLVLMPSGTTASGGATPQTVAMEFYSGALNRNLVKRITASQAKALNKRSFAFD
jgi:hypothetical protein